MGNDEDAVSREAVLTIAGTHTLTVDETIKAIKGLPSVTVRQTGKWIDDEFGSKCSCCGIHTHLDKFDRPMKFKYCSMCGADMRGTDNG